MVDALENQTTGLELKPHESFMSKIFIAGASGFIGQRLILQLLEQGHEVYGLSRIQGATIAHIRHSKFHTVFGDLGLNDTKVHLPDDIDAAYYLVHSMAQHLGSLKDREEQNAKQFLEWINRTKCQHIIYLSGIIHEGNTLSEHLASRQNVERVLQSGKIPVTVLRASIIIGAGSASFEIIRDLVEKLPVMIAPKWVRTRCQPIAVDDVLYFLTKILLMPRAYNQTFEINGPEVMSFKQVLLRYARFRRLKRWIIDVPFLTPRLSSYWLVLITSVRYSICSYLVDSMKYDSSSTDNRIQSIVPHNCLKFEEALERAFMRIAQNEIISTWMDAWFSDGKPADIKYYIQVPHEGCVQDVQRQKLKSDEQTVLDRIWSIGGKNGWYGLNWAWRLRGLFDKLIGGAGMNRGRRNPNKLEVGDPIDFWRVVKAEKKPCHLILYAEMKIPGEAWLEFKIEDGTLMQIATFRPKGVWGRIYWYAMMPFHFSIFRNMAKGLAS